jgi:hypothetical protein
MEDECEYAGHVDCQRRDEPAANHFPGALCWCAWTRSREKGVSEEGNADSSYDGKKGNGGEEYRSNDQKSRRATDEGKHQADARQYEGSNIDPP